jgi:monoamine oxidase
VTVLEARNHTGGRIHTLYNESFFNRAELGAEFIHGDLPVTLGLLKEAGIAAEPAASEMWQHKDGKFVQEEQQVEHWDLVMKTLGDLKEDMSIADFLEKYFSEDKYTEVKRSVTRFVAGYDTADPKKASAFALRNEWQNEDDNAQHRIPEGYCELISYLALECKTHGGLIELNAVVKDIYWEQYNVRAVTTNGTAYTAEQVIIALPLGVLQASAGELGAISFHPPLPDHDEAISQIGFGAIIKILLQLMCLFGKINYTAILKNRAFYLPTRLSQPGGRRARATRCLPAGWVAAPRLR